MAAKKYVQSLTQYLAGSGVVIGATSIVLTSLTDIYGNAITNISSFGDKGYITLEPDTTNEEAATFTSVTANANGTVTLGGVSTVLAQSPYTETSGLVRSHSGGTKVVITDNVGFWNTFANKNNDETILGRWGSATVPSAGNDYANKTYVDGVAVAGAPNANTSTKGIVQEATAAQINSGTATGSTGAILVVAPDQLALANIALAAAGTSGTATGSGNRLVDAADVSNAGVSGKVVRATGTALPALSGANLTGLTLSQISGAFQGLFKTGVSSHSTGAGAQTIAHGLGVIPKYIRISWLHGGPSAASVPAGIYTGTGVYNGTAVSQIYVTLDGSNNVVQGVDTTNIITVNTGGTNNGHTAIPTFDSTNITLTWTITNTPSTTNFMWEAFA